MGSLRRASFHLKNHGLGIGISRICCGKSKVEGYYLENNNAGNIELQGKIYDKLISSTRCYNSYSGFPKSCFKIMSFSSDASAKSNGEDNFEATPGVVPDAISGDENDDGLISKPEHSEEEIYEAYVDEKTRPRTEVISAMTKATLAVSASSVEEVLDKWVEEGNEVTETEALSTISSLRRRRMYVRALQISKWLEKKQQIEFSESFHACIVDIIAKVGGVLKAEGYLNQIPEALRGEEVYRSLLANCASSCNMQKTEEVFKKMKSLGFPISCFSYNQLLILYKNTIKKKIPDVLLLMEKENIKPSIHTYQILIDVKGQQNDIKGMEDIVESMISDGIKPNIRIESTLGLHYTYAGLKDKAEAVLRKLEGEDLTKNRWVTKSLLLLYASLGNEDEVARIWSICESNPQFIESIAAIEAWGRLHRIEKAEAVFDKMMDRMKSPSSKHFIALLKVYANHKMLEKGEDLLKRMEESGILIGPLIWKQLVKLYIGADEIAKAESILEKAVEHRKGKLMFSSFNLILHQYAYRGDIHRAEKIFLKMRHVGFFQGMQQFKLLLRTYMNAKAPVYGLIERMKACNIFPDKEMVNMLAEADAIRKIAGQK